jgi:hypothetical protein
VFGGSRDAQISVCPNLKSLAVWIASICIVTLTDFPSVLQAIARIRPDEIYNPRSALSGCRFNNQWRRSKA